MQCIRRIKKSSSGFSLVSILLCHWKCDFVIDHERPGYEFTRNDNIVWRRTWLNFLVEE